MPTVARRIQRLDPPTVDPFIVRAILSEVSGAKLNATEFGPLPAANGEPSIGRQGSVIANAKGPYAVAELTRHVEKFAGRFDCYANRLSSCLER